MTDKALETDKDLVTDKGTDKALETDKDLDTDKGMVTQWYGDGHKRCGAGQE